MEATSLSLVVLSQETKQKIQVCQYQFHKIDGELYSNLSNMSKSNTFDNHITMPGTTLYFNNEAKNCCGAIYLMHHSVEQFRNNSALYGGLNKITRVVTNTEHLHFIGNKAQFTGGGAIYTYRCLFNFRRKYDYFSNKMSSRLKITGNSFFIMNN